MNALSYQDLSVAEAAEFFISALRKGKIGPTTIEQFESQLAKYVGTKYTLATSSGTAAIHLVLKAMDIGENDEVIVPDCTFPATVNPIEHLGAKPVFVDVEFRTGTIDPTKIEYCITDNTKAVVPVHQFGLSAPLNPILEIAEKANLLVIEDAACALGSEYMGKKCGSFGFAGCFSFNPMKIITTGMGGAITTNDKFLFERCRILRGYGDIQKRFEHPGYNFQISSLNAFLGLVQMGKIEANINHRRSLAQILLNQLNAIEDLWLSLEPVGYRHVYQSYPILLKKPGKRDELRRWLKENGIESYIGSRAIHLEPYYFRKYGYDVNSFPISTQIANSIICLSLSPFMDSDTVEYIAATIEKFFQKKI